MSTHVRNDRRDNRSRFPRRQEWIPRASTATAVDANPLASNSDGNGGEANIRSGGPRALPLSGLAPAASLFPICIVSKKWARAPTSIDLSAEKNQGFNWRCPGSGPPSDPYLTPQSCGELCGRPLEKEISSSGGERDDLCPHRCVLQCHLGPYPPCKAFAPPRIWLCGKEVITTRCSNQKSLLTCCHHCGKLLNCLRHHYDKNCHVGPCDSCDLLINASCFCKKMTEIVVCGDMTVKGQVNVEEDGIFSCTGPYGKPLACGNHVCKDTCHPGVCGDCDLLLGRITSCYCGKSPLQEERHSCLVSIPTCSQICDKTLTCGLHGCKETCHSGSYAPCRVMVTKKCRCGSTSRSVECFNTTKEIDTFTCDKPCGRKKSCCRHRCSDKCYPLSNSNNGVTQGLDPHLCSKPCEKKLRCGQHDCGLLCHSGHCPPCPERIFTDLTCACGRSSTPPPVPCVWNACLFKDLPPAPCDSMISGGSTSVKASWVRNVVHHGETIGTHVLPFVTLIAHAQISETAVPLQAVEATGKKIPLGQRKLMCDDECIKLERKKVLADAFGVTSLNFEAHHFGENPMVSNVGDLYRRDSKWVLAVEERCKMLVVVGGGRGRGSAKVHVFCPMLKEKRDAVRLIAESWVIGAKGLHPHPLSFDHLVDMEPMLVVALFDLPRGFLTLCKMLVVVGGGRGRGGAKVHVFCPKLKEKRDAVRLIAERWKLSISAADMEPRLVVALFDLPSDADVSAFVLRFGGEYELVWLNDKKRAIQLELKLL
ncbi:hypothetical protein L1987_30471 [Smallanthus sonchifolius]|uniref:Uncharacterized protein n=1 Tax=Smallanthus sonchifolius TaxID=185202 RepID=A0ACB9I4P3_9ASTR|nr:hypothetical protein L1987_30471 [Smallanthus sonchifolius]